MTDSDNEQPGMNAELRAAMSRGSDRRAQLAQRLFAPVDDEPDTDQAPTDTA